MEQKLKIKSCWTDHPSCELKHDFISLANAVFGTFVTEDYFKAKFETDVYGPSLLTIAYVNGQPAGADVMWRNDLRGVKAYQTVDTCVLEQYRGMGLFKAMTRWEQEFLGNKTLIYGFPNANSYPGYVKMGWQVKHLYKTLTLVEKDTTPNVIESAYASWWLKAQTGILHIHKRERFYLIRKKKKNPVATLIGRVDETTARLFPESKGACLFKCFKTNPSIYNKNKSIPLVCNQPTMEIPYWKIDAI